MILSEALKVLIGDVEVNEFKRVEAFKIIGTYIADEECNEHKMTYQEWQHLVKDFKALAQNTFENDAKYRESKESMQ